MLIAFPCASSLSSERSSSARPLASLPDRPRSLPNIRNVSRGVSISNNCASCGTIPIRFFTPMGSDTASTPNTRISPEVGSNSVVICLTSVVFPAPFGPSIPRTSPGYASKDMPLFAWTPPLYRLSSPSTASGRSPKEPPRPPFDSLAITPAPAPSSSELKTERRLQKSPSPGYASFPRKRESRNWRLCDCYNPISEIISN